MSSSNKRPSDAGWEPGWLGAEEDVSVGNPISFTRGQAQATLNQIDAARKAQTDAPANQRTIQGKVEDEVRNVDELGSLRTALNAPGATPAMTNDVTAKLKSLDVDLRALPDTSHITLPEAKINLDALIQRARDENSSGT